MFNAAKYKWLARPISAGCIKVSLNMDHLERSYTPISASASKWGKADEEQLCGSGLATQNGFRVQHCMWDLRLGRAIVHCQRNHLRKPKFSRNRAILSAHFQGGNSMRIAALPLLHFLLLSGLRGFPAVRGPQDCPHPAVGSFLSAPLTGWLQGNLS